GLAVVSVPGRRNGSEGPAVEGVLGHDRSKGAAAPLLPPLPRKLQRRLVRLSAAVAEEHLVEWRALDEELRELDLRLGVDQVRSLDQSCCLFGDRASDDRRRMSQAVD